MHHAYHWYHTATHSTLPPPHLCNLRAKPARTTHTHCISNAVSSSRPILLQQLHASTLQHHVYACAPAALRVAPSHHHRATAGAHTFNTFQRTLQHGFTRRDSLSDTDVLVGGMDDSNEMNKVEEKKENSGFNWKRRAKEIKENIHRANMNPSDFGCLERGAVVGPEFSWRGHTKMICSRLASAADPGIPEQMGCPPVSWKGWRL